MHATVQTREAIAQQEVHVGKRVRLRMQKLDDEIRAVADAEAEANSIRVKGAAEAELTRLQAEALEARADDLLRQQVIGQLAAIVRAESEQISAIINMTVILSGGTGTQQVGQSVALQLATSTQLIKDLVGIVIAEIVTARATGAAAGEAISGAGPLSRTPSRATAGAPESAASAPE